MSHTKLICQCCDRVISCRAFLRHIMSNIDDKHSSFLQMLEGKKMLLSSEARKCIMCNCELGIRNFTINETMMLHFDLKAKIPNKCLVCANIPWNLGLTKKTNASMAKLSNERMGINNPIHKVLIDNDARSLWISNLKKGRQEFDKFRAGKTLEEAFGKDRALVIKDRLSIAAKKRTVHGHKGCKHTDETKLKIGINTAKWLSKSKCKVSKPQKILFDALKVSNTIDYALEHMYEIYSIDIAVPDLKLAIEVDGDFFHVNEALGFKPDHHIQKVNMSNDKKKNAFLAKHGWRVLRFWTSDIMLDTASIVRKIEEEVCLIKLLA